ncbi:MAG: DUF6273 domain-containing protein [Bacilli bacterium]|nr:DUF6273 domain-containing protein [Bacilli bacterium]
MKKLVFIMPLMAVSFLASCNNGGDVPPEPEPEERKSLEECSWEEISEGSRTGKASKWFRVGDTKTVKINNKDHKVRIIGFNHDYSELPDEGEPDPNKKLGITFEFANVITDSDGNAVTTPWNPSGSKNYDYRSSTLNTFLNNDVLHMLPSSGDPNNPDLKEVIKQVDKKVGVSTDSGTTYTATSFDGVTYPYPHLFPLAHDEITVEEETHVASDEGETYQYYKSYEHQRYRIKKIAGSDERDVYWLRSPYTGDSDAHDDERATWVDRNGGFTVHYAYFTRALAPAFCI